MPIENDSTSIFWNLSAGLGLALTVALAASPANAQTWPDKPIRLVVPYPPGGGTDTVARHIAEKLSTDQKWQFVVDNKPGAGGNIGIEFVAKAPPNAYTLGLGQTANVAINPALVPNMPFDAVKDIVPVALVAEQAVVLVVRADNPWRNLADLVAAAKIKPGALRQALAGNGTVGHLAGEMLARRAGYTVLSVPYRGAATALTDLLGGQTDYMFATPQAVLGMLQGGKLRALAVTSKKRITVLADVPTVAESGFKDFEAVDWKLIVAPAGTPAELVLRINAAVEKALSSPRMMAQLMAEGSAPMGGNPAQVLRYVRREQAQWGALVREAGIRLD